MEQLLEMFAAGYTLEKPDYSKSFEEMASLAETTPPNDPLTLEELRKMDGEPVGVVHSRGGGSSRSAIAELAFSQNAGSMMLHE